MIEDLTEMMVERLQEYRKTNKALPKRVIIYRDGVSEASGFERLKLINLLTRGDRVNTRVYSKRSSAKKLSRLLGRLGEARSMNQRLLLSSAESDITADFTQQQQTKNQTTVTLFQGRSRTEVSHLPSCSTSTFKRTPASKGRFARLTTSSSMTRTSSMPT